MADRSERFHRETRAQLRTLDTGLMELEAGGDPPTETIDKLFRGAHSLKSNLRMAGFDGASNLAHAVEEALNATRAGTVQPTKQLIDEMLVAVDEIEAILETAGSDEPQPDVDTAVADLRSTIKAERTEPPSTGSTDDDPTAEASTGSKDSMSSNVTPEVDSSDRSDISAEEALERASVFDDLDALIEEIDEDEEFDDLESWGTFSETDEDPDDGFDFDLAENYGDDTLADDSDETTDDSRVAENDDRVAEDDDTDPETPGNSAFDAIKSEVSSTALDDDIHALEADIEAVEFGEFDEDDQLSIEDLLAADPADEVGLEADDAGSEPVPGQKSDDIEPDKDVSFEEITADIDPDEDLEALEADVEAEEFGEFDEEFTIPELIESDPTDVDEETTFDESSSDESKNIESPPPTRIDEDEEAGAARGVTDAISGPPTESDDDLFVTKTPVAAGDESEADSIDSNGTAATGDDVEPGSADESGRGSVDNVDEDQPGDVSDRIQPDESDEIDPDVDELLSDVSVDEGGGDSAEESTADIETEAPDLGELADANSYNGDGNTGLGTNVDAGFTRDAAVEAFEERFGDLFDDTVEAETRVGPAATTLEESSLAVATGVESETSTAVESVGSLGGITVDVDVADSLLRSIEELATGHLQLERALLDGTDGPSPQEVLSELQTITADMRNTVMDVRLTPLSSVTDDLPRVVRRVARERDTEADLVVEGADVTLDRGVIDRLGDPLAHLVRNAVAHGIESPAEREAAGKPSTGTVEVRAEQHRDRVIIEVIDDGRGLDPTQLRLNAVESGAISQPEAIEMSDEEALELAFHPGVSTADELTEVSGRGVGMDVVKQTIDEMNGTVDVDSVKGEGTTIRLDLPVSIAVAEALFVRSGDERYAIPVTAIERVGWPADISTEEGRETVTFSSPSAELSGILSDGDGEYTVKASSDSIDDGSVGPVSADESDGDTDEGGTDKGDAERYPLVRLAESFETAGYRDEDGVVVQLRSDLRRLVIHCDEIGGTHEVIVDPYTGPLASVPGISGATALGDGELVNVIDVHSL